MLQRFNTLVIIFVILISSVISLESSNSIFADQSQGMTLSQRNEQRTRKKNEVISKLIEQRAKKEKEMEYKGRHSQATSNQISNNNNNNNDNNLQSTDIRFKSSTTANDDTLGKQQPDTSLIKEYHSILRPHKTKQIKIDSNNNIQVLPSKFYSKKNIKTLKVKQLPYDPEDKVRNQTPSDYFANQEKLAELYYHNQKGEIRKPMGGTFPYLNANFPCIQGTNAVGSNTPSSIFDGHKYAW
jgi:hypothetical protein